MTVPEEAATHAALLASQPRLRRGAGFSRQSPSFVASSVDFDHIAPEDLPVVSPSRVVPATARRVPRATLVPGAELVPGADPASGLPRASLPRTSPPRGDFIVDPLAAMDAPPADLLPNLVDVEALARDHAESACAGTAEGLGPGMAPGPGWMAPGPSPVSAPGPSRGKSRAHPGANLGPAADAERRRREDHVRAAERGTPAGTDRRLGRDRADVRGGADATGGGARRRAAPNAADPGWVPGFRGRSSRGSRRTRAPRRPRRRHGRATHAERRREQSPVFEGDERDVHGRAHRRRRVREPERTDARGELGANGAGDESGGGADPGRIRPPTPPPRRRKRRRLGRESARERGRRRPPLRSPRLRPRRRRP